jgi:hypothetical protein
MKAQASAHGERAERAPQERAGQAASGQALHAGGFVDQRPMAVAQRQRMAMMNSGRHAMQLKAGVELLQNGVGPDPKAVREALDEDDDDVADEVAVTALDAEAEDAIADDGDDEAGDVADDADADTGELEDEDEDAIEAAANDQAPEAPVQRLRLTGADQHPVLQRISNKKTNKSGKAAKKAAVEKKKKRPFKGFGGSGARSRKRRLQNRYKHHIDLVKYQFAIAAAPDLQAPVHTNIQALSGAAGRSEVIFGKMTPTSDPQNLLNWPDTADKLNIIKEKNGNNLLTRMHQIRGRFGGASAAQNMFLGTALSNNFHEHSHYAKVESWMEQALPLDKTSVIRYIVEPGFGTVPDYITARIAASGQSDQWKQAMTDWCKQATPATFKTTVTHYYVDQQLQPRESNTDVQTLSAQI